MKKLALLFPLLAMPIQAEASNTSIEMCRLYGDLALTIMNDRQFGTRQSTVLSRMEEIAMPDDIRQSIELMVTLAYTYPLYSTDEYQARAAVEFQDEIETICFSN